MKFKKVLASILSVAMIFSMMSFSVFAEEADVWDGETYSLDWLEQGNPEGTPGESFYLNSAADLAGLAYYVNNYSNTNNIFTGDTVYLNVDIDLNNCPWTPIGTLTTEKRHFFGSFDGQNHIISNLYVPAKYYYAGLFGRFKGTGFAQTFSNLTIHNVDIESVASDDGKEGAGALMGYGYDNIITNCHVTGNISITGNANVGGIAGHSRAEISNSSVEASGSITAESQAGGLVGYFVYAEKGDNSAKITNCSVDGGDNGIVVESSNEYVGGLAGFANSKIKVIDTVSVSNVTVNALDSNSGAGAALIAQNFNATNATVSNVTTTLGNESCVPSDAEAKIGDTYYTSFYDAVVYAAENGAAVELLSDVAVDNWQQLTNKSLDIIGNNHIVTINSITKNTLDNGGALIRNTTDQVLNFSDVTFVLPEGAVVAYTVGGKMDNVTVTGGRYGFCVWADTDFTNCTFNGQSGEALYFKDGDGAPGSVVDGCTFNLENARVGALWSDEVFTNNVINYTGDAITGLTILSNSSATVKGNVMSADTNIEFYVPNEEQGSFTLSENNIAGSVFTAGAALTNQFENVVIESNTLSDEALAGLKEIKSDVTSVNTVALVNGKEYYYLEEAINAAQDGETVILLEDVETDETIDVSGNSFKIDLNGHEITSSKNDYIIYVNGGNVEFIDSSAEKTGGVFSDGDYCLFVGNGSIVINGGTYTSGWGYTIVLGENGILTVNDGKILSNGFAISGNGTYHGTEITINGGEILSENPPAGYERDAIGIYHPQNGTLTINGGTITGATALYVRGGNITINDGTLNATGDDWSDSFDVNDDGAVASGDAAVFVSCDYPAGNPAVAINGGTFNSANADAVAVYQYESGIAPANFISGGSFSSDVSALLADDFALEQNADGKYMVVEEELVEETIYVLFEEITEDAAEDEKLYNINLVAAEDGIINRLNTVDLTFALGQITGNNKYEIIASNGEVTINPVDNSTDRYEFHYDGKNNVTTDIGNTITIGQVKFTGYGSFSFSVDTNANSTNVVHATKLYDNIVDTFVVGGDAANGKGELVINTTDVVKDGMTGTINAEIEVPTRDLAINVTFPNAVEDNASAYQNMTVTIEGNDIDTITYNLGSEIGQQADGSYELIVDDMLTLNTAYNVTVKGAGYRTARYTVTMTEDKELTFWNNVMDDNKAMEVNKVTAEEKGAAKLNFLAGDIVADNNINIYDLSAVVSYFATTNDTSAYSDYAKYDLNRDGVIDSKDVAYVLVSWNN